MSSYLIDVSEILESTGFVESVDAPFDLDVLRIGAEEFIPLEPAVVDLVISNAGSGIVASGTVSARVQAQCARCLRAFELALKGEVEGFYVDRTGSADADDAEPILANKTIDIGPALIAALVIEAPFVPLHDPDCRGLCPQCGVDLNESPCECLPAIEETHPFSVLRDLLVEDDTADNRQ